MYMLFFIAPIDNLIFDDGLLMQHFAIGHYRTNLLEGEVFCDRVNFHLNGLYYYFPVSLPRRISNRIIKSINTPV